MRVRFLTFSLLGLLVACGDGDSLSVVDPGADGGTDDPDAGPPAVCTEATGEAEAALRVSEVLTNNDGAWIDERGETDDLVELVNTGSTPLELADYLIRDASHVAQSLPRHTLAPGAAVVLWADEELDQGPLHLPFKLGSDGDRVELLNRDCERLERVDVPALPTNEVYARFGTTFAVCPYASPGKPNPATCEPPPPPELTDDVTFADYTFPAGYPAAPRSLRLSELGLRPAAFIELVNAGEAVTPSTHQLRIATMPPGAPWPGVGDGVAIPLPATSLPPNGRITVDVSETQVAALTADPAFEGVVTLFDAAGEVVDRADFMRWPEGTTLARAPESARNFSYCTNATRGAANTCSELAERDVGDRLRHLRVATDFARLARGGSDVGLSGVKFVVDLESGPEPVVHVLGSEKWALHYTFVREQIDRDVPLDRCDAEQSALFHQGWVAFSEREYYRVSGRRYLLGTFVRHASGLHTIEFAAGDAISPDQMLRAFFTAVAHTDNPTDWALRPIDNAQLERMREIEGKLPIVGPNAPFVGVRYQPLTPAVGFGELRFVRTDELETAELGAHVIVLTDAVPNDVPFVGGLITEAFQTPLAHVNVLSRARGTPNMALRKAREHARVMPLLGRLVRLEVGADDFTLREATPEEADAYWRSREPTGPRTVPPLDASLRGVVSLRGRGIEDVPSLGAKAAQFAELYRVDKARARCPVSSVPLNVPDGALGIPVSHYLDHFEQSGARAKLTALLDDPAFRADPAMHVKGLSDVRHLIQAHPVDPALLTEIQTKVRANFGAERVRFRSSSNTEDLPTFNGAGLHGSFSAEVDSDELPVESAIRAVWASLWNARAFDEREAAHLDQTGVAMGILIHNAHRGEAAQGVAISRNYLHVTRNGTYYINAQEGEATVTNPAPGVGTEQILYTFPPRAPEVEVMSRSTLTEGGPVLTLKQTQAVACATGAVHEHFRPLLNPDGANRLFAMQIEWKIMRETGQLIVKQARPQPFAAGDIPQDCREF